ncbi:DUF3592 domain-containing protein [Leptospira interrogans]|uniref:DUF3592 domain-containing protein n=1 Tax=Leptospira interrogans TaxID=173 RepID=UPI0002BED245|nr:DUF3592 domain-containing protein [Leptospira interrogans]EMN51815.1 PF12158 family protein [Leptospira interrogans serovar Autumnalis str. LP101]EMN65028.1 PF12158 family protein [Leptospira interrogans serovar Grippotyphosa str. UI 08434]
MNSKKDLKRKKNKISIGEVIVALLIISVISLFSGLSILGILQFGKEIYVSWDSISWHPTTAKITSHPSEMEEVDGVVQKKRFLYDYVIDGVSYRNGNVRLGLNQNEIEFYAQNLKKDEIISIYYNPEKPQETLIENDIRLLDLLYSIGFLIFCLLLTTTFFSVKVFIAMSLFGKDKIAANAMALLFGTMLTLFTFMPLTFILFSVYEIYKGIETLSWEKVEGKILSAKITKNSTNSRVSWSNRKTIAIDQADIFYQYKVDEKLYINSKISYLKNLPYFGEEFDKINLYRDQTSMIVFFNPDSKRESVLIQGTGLFPFFLLILGISFSNVFGCILLTYLHSRGIFTKKITPQKLRTVFISSFWIPFLTLSAFVSFLGFQEVYKHHQAESWPTTQATILNAYVEEVYDKDNDYSRRDKITYYPEIEYQYKVGDQEYIGNRIQIGGRTGLNNPSFASQIVQKYKTNDHTLVHYNPQNPTEAYLDLSSVLRSYTMGIVSAILCFFFFLIFRFILSRN